ncbi:MAG: cytidine deaminase, partial [Clostridia bacterium]
IENAAYPVGICAERVAASNSIMDGNKKIDSIHLLTQTIDFGMPCGMCRQFLSEFMEDDSVFYIYNKKGDCKAINMKDILPHRFTKKDLC